MKCSKQGLSRRAVSLGGVALFGAGMLPAASQGQGAYPDKAIRFIVPFAPGGVSDIMSRMIAEHLQSLWGQPVVVENKPGAGTALGMDAVAKAAPDGYTIGMGNIAANAINPAFQRDRVPYEPVTDFSAITNVAIAPSILVINPAKVPVKTLPEFIAYLKANPDKVSFGSSGVGTSLHIGMELFMLKSGTKMVHVPYRGSAPMLNDLLAGHVDVAMDAPSTSWPHVQTGKLIALGVTSGERAFFAPDLAPLKETVPGVEVKAWHGVMGPAGIPAPIVDKLSTAIAAFLRKPETVAKLNQQGVIPVGNSPAAFAAFMAEEYALYRKVIADAGIKAP